MNNRKTLERQKLIQKLKKEGKIKKPQTKPNGDYNYNC